MKIKIAEIAEYSKIKDFYHSLIEEMHGSEFYIGWEKDIYPSIDLLKNSIAEENLLIGMEEDTIVAAMILNHQYNEGYKKIEWPTKAADSEVSVVHALGVHPKSKGKGYAKQMIYEAFSVARGNSQKVIRLDVLQGNIPAERLYTSLGFKYVHTIKMFYEDTGWTNYKLYEHVL